MLQIDNNRLQNKILGLIIVITTVFILFVNMESNSVNIYAQEQQQKQKEISNSSIVLTAKLVDEEYKWIDANNTVNPTLNITSGTDNQITIESLKGDTEEHELIIEGMPSATADAANDGKGEELVKSDDIEDGSSTIINFNPSDIDTNNYQSLEYYCEYHPDTMRGKVQIN